ncbi:MAG: hypothetical protein JSR67_14770 [Proteobacteria bacterium]|nr:hypothetical protein [Pseudomonadota bacterium]
MRNLFFALVFVNLAYFAWARWVDVPRPIATNTAIAHLPRLKLASEVPPDQRAAAAQPAVSTVPSSSVDCVSVGPFGDLDSSARAAAVLRIKGFDPHQRAAAGETSEGYWAYIADLKNQRDTDRALATLEKGGIHDALVMPPAGDAGRRISLGLFSEAARAERRAASARTLGLTVQVAERKLPGTLYWVDMAPLPGNSSVPLRDLFAEGVGSRIAVQPCPPAGVRPATQIASPASPANRPTRSAQAGPPGPATPRTPRAKVP